VIVGIGKSAERLMLVEDDSRDDDKPPVDSECAKEPAGERAGNGEAMGERGEESAELLFASLTPAVTSRLRTGDGFRDMSCESPAMGTASERELLSDSNLERAAILSTSPMSIASLFSPTQTTGSVHSHWAHLDSAGGKIATREVESHVMCIPAHSTDAGHSGGGTLALAVVRHREHQGTCLREPHVNQEGVDVFSGGGDGAVRMWHLPALAGGSVAQDASRYGMQLVKEWKAHTGGVTCMCAGDGRLYTGGRDAAVRVWDACEAYKQTACMKGHRGQISALIVEGRQLYSAAWDGFIRVWDVASHACLMAVEDANRCCCNSVVCANVWNIRLLDACMCVLQYGESKPTSLLCVCGHREASCCICDTQVWPCSVLTLLTPCATT
jgi:hypothetical protein